MRDCSVKMISSDLLLISSDPLAAPHEGLLCVLDLSTLSVYSSNVLLVKMISLYLP
jgi:hypothetical protein